MCIAIVKTKDGKITDQQLRNCFDNNPDGAGIAYSSNGELYYVKGIFDDKELIEQVREAEKVADGAMLIHCRISTSGLVDKDNCHPHVVNGTTVMIHNGILDIDVPKDSKKSDTVLFVEQLLSQLPEDFMNDKGILKLIEFTIGHANKFCFLNNKGEYAICNEDAGHWKDGVWFSNTTYSYSSYYKWYNYGKKNSKKSNTSLNPYSCYDYGYGYDEDDEWFYENYGLTKDEFVEEYGLTKTEKVKLKDIIKNLTDEQLKELGELPVYDLATGTLKGEHEYTGYGDMFLQDLDDNLQYLYEAKYYDYFDEEEFEEVFNEDFEFVDEDEELQDGEILDEDDEDYYDGWQFLRRHADEFDELNDEVVDSKVEDTKTNGIKLIPMLNKMTANG